MTIKRQEFADKQVTASAVWREALAIIWRYPLAVVVPAAVLGLLGCSLLLHQRLA
jgi:hypothetical protein